jgi:hypothetical protein
MFMLHEIKHENSHGHGHEDGHRQRNWLGHGRGMGIDTGTGHRHPRENTDSMKELFASKIEWLSNEAKLSLLQ